MEQLAPSPTDRPGRMTVTEYLALEETSTVKHEYRRGEVVDMAGGTFDHGAIAANLIREVGNQLKGKGCTVVGSDVSVRVDATSSYCYPDVTVVCGPPVFDPPDRRRVMVNPQVVVGVLSPSMADLDRREKFYDYIQIATLQDYVLVDSGRPRADTFYRQPDGVWAIGPSFVGMDAAVTFRSLGVSVPLSEVYAGVTFPPVPTPRAKPRDDDDAES